jgi:hypothetical protein
MEALEGKLIVNRDLGADVAAVTAATAGAVVQ